MCTNEEIAFAIPSPSRMIASKEEDYFKSPECTFIHFSIFKQVLTTALVLQFYLFLIQGGLKLTVQPSLLPDLRDSPSQALRLQLCITMADSFLFNQTFVMECVG